MDWEFIVAGFGVGFLVGLTGVGGGSLMTPLLIFVFGIKPVIAVGTDLIFAAITKTGGVWVHARRNTIDWHIFRLLSMGALPMALITIYMLGQYQFNTAELNELIFSVIGFSLLLTAFSLLFKSSIVHFSQRLRDSNPQWRTIRIPLTILSGALLGVLVPLSSIGAGVIGSVALLFLYPRMAMVKIVGTNLAMAVPLSAISGFGHWQLMDSVDFVLLGYLLVGSLPGIYLGSHMGFNIPEKVMRFILAGILFLIGFKFILA